MCGRDNEEYREKQLYTCLLNVREKAWLHYYVLKMSPHAPRWRMVHLSTSRPQLSADGPSPHTAPVRTRNGSPRMVYAPAAD